MDGVKKYLSITRSSAVAEIAVRTVWNGMATPCRHVNFKFENFGVLRAGVGVESCKIVSL